MESINQVKDALKVWLSTLKYLIDDNLKKISQVEELFLIIINSHLRKKQG